MRARVPLMAYREASRPTGADDRRVVMVSAEYPPDVLGGAEGQCQKLSAALARRGRRVTVVTSSTRPDRGPTVVDDVEIVRFRSRSSPQLGGRRLASSVIWGARLYRWVKANRSDILVLHAHQAKMNAVWAVLAGWRQDIPVVVKVGTGSPRFDLDRLRRKRYLYGRLAELMVRRLAARFVAISATIEKDLRDAGVRESKIVCLPNGVQRLSDHPLTDAERAAARRQLGLEERGTYFVYTGRLSPQKNLPMLLDAFGHIGEQEGKSCLIIVGDGELRHDLEAQAARGGYADRVTFTGTVEDVASYLRAADAFVLPSLAEGSSNSLLEAMSVGIVPIVSAIGGNMDAVCHGVSGLLFELDPVSAEEALRIFMRSGQRRREDMAAVAFGASAKHDVDLLAVSYEKLYEEVKADACSRAAVGSRASRLVVIVSRGARQLR